MPTITIQPVVNRAHGGQSPEWSMYSYLPRTDVLTHYWERPMDQTAVSGADPKRRSIYLCCLRSSSRIRLDLKVLVTTNGTHTLSACKKRALTIGGHMPDIIYRTYCDDMHTVISLPPWLSFSHSPFLSICSWLFPLSSFLSHPPFPSPHFPCVSVCLYLSLHRFYLYPIFHTSVHVSIPKFVPPISIYSLPITSSFNPRVLSFHSFDCPCDHWSKQTMH